MTQFELTDRQIDWLCYLIDGEWRGRGRPSANRRRHLEGLVWIATSGRPWRDLPEAFGPWNSAYRQFLRWTKDGLWDLIDLALTAPVPQSGSHRFDFGPPELTMRRVLVESLPDLSEAQRRGLRELAVVARELGKRTHSRLRKMRLGRLDPD